MPLEIIGVLIGIAAGVIGKILIDARTSDGSAALNVYRDMLKNLQAELEKQKVELSDLRKSDQECRERDVLKSEQLRKLQEELTSLHVEMVARMPMAKIILDAVTYAVVATDERGVIQAWNCASTTLLGWMPAEMLGENVRKIVSEPHRDKHDKYLNDYIRTNRAKIIGVGREVDAVHRDGHVVKIKLSVGEARLQGTDHRIFIGVMRKADEDG